MYRQGYPSIRSAHGRELTRLRVGRRTVLPILRVLMRRADALTASQVRTRAETGTDAGVRRALERLGASGLVDAASVGDRTVFTLNP
jgi:hypothetical protein